MATRIRRCRSSKFFGGRPGHDDMLEHVQWEGLAFDEGFDLDGITWKCVWYPTGRLLSMPAGECHGLKTRSSWKAWLDTEMAHAGREYYENLAAAWISDPESIGPVIIVEEGGCYSIGDGWHRAAISVIAGEPHMFAILGVRS